MTSLPRSPLLPLLSTTLNAFVAEASHSLPPYELRSALTVVFDLRAAHKAAASEIRTKKTFSFRNKSKTTKNPPQDPPALPQPPPEQPKPSSDTLLTGFGFRNRNGATLVKDLRVDNEKDGDFTLADLVSCEVYLKGKCRALYIHKLRDCRVFIGPVFVSVLIEDVERCTFAMAAHQIRIHEARAVDFYLRVRSRPIVEDCCGVRFAPHALKYAGIEEDLRDSGLAEDTGNWANVDDFKCSEHCSHQTGVWFRRKSVCRLSTFQKFRNRRIVAELLRRFHSQFQFFD